VSGLIISSPFEHRISWGDSTIHGIRWRLTAAGGKVLQFMTHENWKQGNDAGQSEIWTDVPEEFIP
jgi:hypothetical protein